MAEEYKGIKFKAVFLERKAPENKKNRELLEWCKKLDRLGLSPSYGAGSSGNASFRTENGFVITATKTFLGKINAKELVEIVEFNERKNTALIKGLKNPSSETPMHAGIYRRFKKAEAIFHVHDEAALKYAEKIGIPATEKETVYGTIGQMKAALMALKKSRYAVLKGHGGIAFGKTLGETGRLVEKIHEKALKAEKNNSRVPSRKYCLNLLRKNNPENIIKHCLKVNQAAVRIAKALKRKGINVNVRLVDKASLLHDVDKFGEIKFGRGYKKAEKMLAGKGFKRVAEIIGKTALSNIVEGNLENWEEKIVFLADKRVKHDRIVSLNERFKYLEKRYGSTSREFMKKIRKAKPLTERLQKEIFRITGRLF